MFGFFERWFGAAQQERVFQPDFFQRLFKDTPLQAFHVNHDIRQFGHDVSGEKRVFRYPNPLTKAEYNLEDVLGDSFWGEWDWTMSTVQKKLVVLYRWRIHPGLEDQFIQAWSKISVLLKAKGSLGSRLHRGADGIWYSYAQWPNARARDDAFSREPFDQESSTLMQAAVAERLPELHLEPVADFLQPLPT